MFNIQLLKIIKKKFFKEWTLLEEKEELIKRFEKIEFQNIDLHNEMNCFNSNDIWSIFEYNSGNDEVFRELLNLKSEKEYEKEISLKNIDSILASKSNSINYKSIFEFGFANNISYEDAYDGLKNEAEKRGFRFYKYEWNGRLSWNNNGTSHRVSSFICHLYSRNEDYKVNGTIIEVYFEKEKLDVFFNKYELFLMNDNSVPEVFSLLKASSNNQIKIKIANTKIDELKILIIMKDTVMNDNIIINELKKAKDSKVLNIEEFLYFRVKKD